MIAETAADLCRYLNELTALDPRAMYRQVRTLSPCNDAVWYRLTERRVVTSDVGAMLGTLGLLNGWLAESGFALVVKLNHDNAIAGGFDVESITDAPADPEADPDGA